MHCSTVLCQKLVRLVRIVRGRGVHLSFDKFCTNILTQDGRELLWADDIRYLGVYIVSAKVFTCSFSKAKQSFYRAFNGIFGKVGRVASEEVILELVKTKCMPAMLYGLDACPVNVSQLNSLQFAVTGMLMKLFCTKNKDLIDECMTLFCFDTVSTNVYKRKRNFLFKYTTIGNSLCKLFTDVATAELNLVAVKLS